MRVLIQEKTQSKKASSRFLSGKAVATFLSMLLAVFVTLPAYSQNIQVKGHVSDENGQPVAKASVIVKGTTTGVTADDNGNYQISVPKNAVFLITAVNFAPQEVRINGRETVDVTMVSLEKTQEEVVITGYGTTRKKDVTGSISSISSVTLKEVPSINIVDQLKGRTAGVSIVSNSGSVGAIPQIRIRGNRTLTTSWVLVMR